MKALRYAIFLPAGMAVLLVCVLMLPLLVLIGAGLQLLDFVCGRTAPSVSGSGSAS